jgi:hypothetical protein
MLTRERVIEILDYDPETGIFRWKMPVSRRVRIGERAGSRNQKGYRQIRINRRFYVAHRLAWLVVHGKWPVHQLDHINRQTDDNRIANLREATQTQNKANSRIYKNNSSGYKGVAWNKTVGKWAAYIRSGGARTHLGYFASPEEAHRAYSAAAPAVFGEFATDR